MARLRLSHRVSADAPQHPGPRTRRARSGMVNGNDRRAGSRSRRSPDRRPGTPTPLGRHVPPAVEGGYRGGQDTRAMSPVDRDGSVPRPRHPGARRPTRLLVPPERRRVELVLPLRCHLAAMPSPTRCRDLPNRRPVGSGRWRPSPAGLPKPDRTPPAAPPRADRLPPSQCRNQLLRCDRGGPLPASPSACGTAVAGVGGLRVRSGRP